MMIAPEVYYEENIARKSPKEILKEIKSIKAEIRRLKAIEENPIEENIFDRFMDPSLEVRIKCCHLYLQKAIKGLEEIGTKYIPSAEEKRATEFDDNIKNITQFSLNIGGYFAGFHTYTVDITDSKATLVVKHFKSLEQYPVEKNIFLEDLKDLYIGEWENSYYPEELIEDCCQ